MSEFQEHQEQVSGALKSLFADPCIPAGEDTHVCLNHVNSHFLLFVSGPLISEESVYKAFPGKGKLTGKVLESLAASGEVVLHLFPPSKGLNQTYLDAMAHVPVVNGKHRTRYPFNPMRASLELVGGKYLPAALLLDQVRFWTPNRGIWRDDRVWIAKSREVWLVETGLTLKQYNTALSILKVRELVQTSQHKFRGRDAITFLRPLTYIAQTENVV